MKDADYLSRVRDLPCCICQLEGRVQRGPTTAHHCFHDRFSRKKSSDYDAIPLCDPHHQGLWGLDPTAIAIHKQKKTWRERYGPDHGFIEQIRKACGYKEKG